MPTTPNNERQSNCPCEMRATDRSIDRQRSIYSERFQSLMLSSHHTPPPDIMKKGNTNTSYSKPRIAIVCSSEHFREAINDTQRQRQTQKTASKLQQQRQRQRQHCWAEERGRHDHGTWNMESVS
eukprot:TRINITY_DN7301_c0_g1_i2.p2 TRINITY_DN7301_c0_g1~~TRINITY_DN7301_c0_g1_i2.p2  ORF type:complete len:125 (+),score=0.29 TRINITY_DN7301_c0_g1_i2:84-458(+)